MIRIHFIILFLALCIAGFGQKKSEIAQEKIKSIVVTEQKFDGAASKTFKESETYYDTKGNVIEEKLYKDGKLDSHMKYQYDSNNNKIKETELELGGKVKKISEYKYIGSLRTEKTVYNASGKVKSKKTYKYEKF